MITKLQIDNFKSLKDINVGFAPFNFIVGPNASGKSNLVEALDFISHAARENLQYAVAEKGGFFNICNRRQRRARGGIRFAISCSFELDEHGVRDCVAYADKVWNDNLLAQPECDESCKIVG